MVWGTEFTHMAIWCFGDGSFCYCHYRTSLPLEVVPSQQKDTSKRDVCFCDWFLLKQRKGRWRNSGLFGQLRASWPCWKLSVKEQPVKFIRTLIKAFCSPGIGAYQKNDCSHKHHVWMFFFYHPVRWEVACLSEWLIRAEMSALTNAWWCSCFVFPSVLSLNFPIVKTHKHWSVCNKDGSW